MFRKSLIAPLLAASAMALAATPAYAGKEDRARAAIAAAEAKVQTVESLGGATEMPGQTADARAALAMAREHFRADRDTAATSAAIRATSLAEAAIGELQRRKDMAVISAQEARAQDVAAAQHQAASAQNQAADANARAGAAERSAAASAAEAQAARLAAQQPTQVETTVVTQQPAVRTARPAPRKVTRTPVRRTTTTVAPATTTTTTVRQAVN